MKIVINKLIPFPGFIAMNLFGCLFVRQDEKEKLSEITINHEAIHTAQIKEMWYIFFYIWYLFEWIYRVLFIYEDFHDAYRNLKFEKEAYDNQDNLDYLKTRKKFAWL